MKSLGLIIGILLSFLLICTFAVGANDEVIIGVYEPMTGQSAQFGQMAMEGIELALEQTPTVLGKPIKMVLADTKTEKVEAANAVVRLIEFEKAVAIVGCFNSSGAIPGSEVCNKAGIPMVGDMCSNPLVTLGKPYAFRACFIDPFQASVMAKYAVNNLHAKTAVVILAIDNDAGVAQSKFFQESFIKLTGDPKSIIGVTAYKTGDQDFTAQVTYAASKNPDVIFLPAGDMYLVVKQAREMGVTSQLLATDNVDIPEFLSVAGEGAEGICFTTHFDAEAVTTKAAKRFTQDFEKKYNKPTNAPAALAFDAFNLVIDAIKRAGSADPKAIKDALAVTKDYEGVSGVITMDSNGDAVKDVIVKTVENGKFKYLFTAHPY